jgi:hypothetical protein
LTRLRQTATAAVREACLRAAGLLRSSSSRSSTPPSSATPGLRVTIAATIAPSINSRQGNERVCKEFQDRAARWAA